MSVFRPPHDDDCPVCHERYTAQLPPLPRRVKAALWMVLGAALIVLGFWLSTGTAGAQGASIDHPARSVPDLVHVIYHAAYVHGVNGDQLVRIAVCESRLDPFAYNRSDGSMGLFQFQPRTFAYASVGAGFAGASPYDTLAAAYSAAWLMRVEGPRHWTCR